MQAVVEEITPPVWASLTGETFQSNTLDWAALPDGRRLLLNGSDNGYSHVWDIASGEPEQLLAQHDDRVLAVACAALPGGQLMVATGGIDRVVRVWGARTGREVRRLAGHQGAVNAVAWAVLPSGEALVATGGDDAMVRIWDGATGRERHHLPVGDAHIHLVTSVAFAVRPDGQVLLAAAVDDGDDQAAVHLWDGLTGGRRHALAIPPGGPGLGGIAWRSAALAADPAGRLLVAANGNAGAHVWDADTGQPVRSVHGPAAKAVAWGRTPDGAPVLVTAAADGIAVVDLATGREVAAIDVKDGGYFRAIAVTPAPDGALLVAAAWASDTLARIWRIELGGPTTTSRPEESISELVDRLERRIQRGLRAKDPEALLGPAAEREAAALWQALRAGDPHPELADEEYRTLATAHLGWLYFLRQELTKSEAGLPDLARAVLCLAQCAETPEVMPGAMERMLGPAADPDLQAHFAIALLTQSTQLDDPALLDAGITLLMPAADALPPGDTDRGTRLSNLCLAMRSRFRRDGTTGDLDRAIAMGEEAVAVPGMHDADPVGPRFNLAYAYWDRFRHSGTPSDILRAIDLLAQVAASFPPGPRRSEWLTEVAQAAAQLSDRTGDPAALARSIEAAEQAVAALPHEPKEAAAALYTLATGMFRRHGRTASADDLHRAVDLAERAVAAAPEGHPAFVDYQAGTAWFHLARYAAGLDPDGLRRATELSEAAVAAAPENPTALAAAVALLQERYRHAGTAADLDRAIRLAGQAVLTGSSPDELRLHAVLAGAHLARYQDAGALDDLGTAIDLWHSLLAGPAGSPAERASWAAMLGSAYQQRFTSTQRPADLDRAIEYGERAVAAADPNGVDIGGWLGKLAIAYWRRHVATADPDHRSRAIECGERAVAATAKGDPERAEWLSNLASAYLVPVHVTERSLADIERGIELSEEAVAEYPDHMPGRVRLVGNLAMAYRNRLWAGGPGVDVPRVHELAGLVEVNAVPVDRVLGRYGVGTLAQAVGEHQLAVRLLDAAVELLPGVAPQEAGWLDQQHRLGEHLGLVGAAVAAHCAVGDPAGAVEVAELGRGVLLANEAKRRSGHTGPKRARLADLLPAAAGGAVVMVNASHHRADAVVLRADSEPVLVELPDVHSTDVEDRAFALTELMTADGTTLTARLRAQRELPEILGWLWDTVAVPVLAALPEGDPMRRIWWLPIGFLGLFPLHAAGHAGQPGMLDAAISSYVPTLRILRDAQARPAAAERRQLVVALHHTPGLPDLPGTADEAAELHARNPGTALVDDQATADRVLAALTESTWAHFACHAVADLDSPTEGGLFLYDRPLRLPEIGALHLPHAELVYLSACWSAQHGRRNADEALHLASTFHLAGFRHTVASLWPLDDRIATETARAFYRELPTAPAAEATATALHRVALALRAAEPRRPDLWAALIHSGP